MSFLNGLFLLALPLAAAPIVVHLFHRRQRVVIPWAAMQFLEEAAVTGRTSRKIEEWLLLLVRTVLLLAVILACAQPLIRTSRLGSTEGFETILVLDDSLSMSRQVAESSAFVEMQRMAIDAIDGLNANDAVQVLLASQQQWLTQEGIPATAATKSRLREAILELKASQDAADLGSSLNTVAAIEPRPDGMRRKVIVLSDGQLTSWQPTNEVAWQRAQQAIEKSIGAAAVQFVDCTPQSTPVNNLAVIHLSALRTLVAVNEQVVCTAEIRNFGESSTAPTSLTWHVDGEHVGTSKVPRLRAGEATRVDWDYRFEGFGPHRIDAQIAEHDDQLSVDDKNSLIVEVVEQVPVIVLGRGSAYDPVRSDSHFVTTALGWNEPSSDEVGQPSWKSVFAPKIVDEQQFAELPLDEYRAVIIPDLPPLEEETLDRLRRFVVAGGGVWVGLGKRVSTERFNRDWFAEGDGLSPLALGTQPSPSGTSTPEDRIHPPGGDNNMTAVLGDTKRLDLDQIIITKRHPFVVGTESGESTSGQINTLLRTGSGAPIAVEQFVGRGRVVIHAIPMSRDWSNLVLTRSFVVMVHNWLDYLTRGSGTNFNLQPGQPLQVAAPPDFEGRVVLESESGEETSLPGFERSGKEYYRSSRNAVPGIFDVRFLAANGDETVFPFHVARPEEESDLADMDENDWKDLASRTGLNQEAPTATADAPQQPTMANMAPYLLILALAAFLAEFLLSHRIAMQRQAQDIAATTVMPSAATPSESLIHS